MASNSASVYVNAQCDEGAHFFLVADLSFIQPLESKTMLSLTSYNMDIAVTEE